MRVSQGHITDSECLLERQWLHITTQTYVYKRRMLKACSTPVQPLLEVLQCCAWQQPQIPQAFAQQLHTQLVYLAQSVPRHSRFQAPAGRSAKAGRRYGCMQNIWSYAITRLASYYDHRLLFSLAKCLKHIYAAVHGSKSHALALPNRQPPAHTDVPLKPVSPAPHFQHGLVHLPLLSSVPAVDRPCACHIRHIAVVLTASVHQQNLAITNLQRQPQCVLAHVRGRKQEAALLQDAAPQDRQGLKH